MDINLFQKLAPYLSSAHSGQTRRDKITSYFYGHCMVVANHPYLHPKGWTCGHEYYIQRLSALGHDVLEDTSETPESLRAAGFPEEVIETIVILTKKEGQDYMEYLAGVKAHPLAKKIKIADMLSNLADRPTEKQILKCAKGLQFLLS